MGDNFFLLLILLAIVAIGLREDFVLTLVYFFVGVYAVGRWWSHRALSAVQFTRTFPKRAFLSEKVPLKLELINTRWLPVIWAQISESLPVELIVPNSFQRVVSLGPKGRATYTFTLNADKRGYYPIGPLHLRSGDVIGLAEDIQNEGRADNLIVYPRIIPLAHVPLPSRSPLGTLRHTQPMFEDPSRVRGKRDYVAGDSLRRVDWKATASTGRLQVKQFEPSIALETAIVLNLNADEYDYRTRYDATELAVVVAASVANWIVGQRQSVGLWVNGEDPLSTQPPAAISPHKGRAHLTRLLDVLARVRSIKTQPLVNQLRQTLPRLSWGTTLIVITGSVDDALFDEIFRARRAGLDVLIALMGLVPDRVAVIQRARHFGVPLYEFTHERDLDAWRK
ncbi:MAG: DUF58 domain-containing protein [Thermoflexales bacterium]|nr:DUF58 domain-containing protein [Thermoflexales bacterium]